MTELKRLLDEAAGPEEFLTDDQLSGAIARGRRSRRRRGAAVVAATAVVAVGVGGWALALPPAGDAPVAAGSGPGAGPTTCAQVVTEYRIERTKLDPGPGSINADVVKLRLGGFPRQTESPADGESMPALTVGWPLSSAVKFQPGATIDVPPPSGKGWPGETWTKFSRTCYEPTKAR